MTAERGEAVTSLAQRDKGWLPRAGHWSDGYTR